MGIYNGKNLLGETMRKKRAVATSCCFNAGYLLIRGEVLNIDYSLNINAI